jgi:hypothetical protein
MTEISRNWDRDGELLVHYTNDSHVPDYVDPRQENMGGHRTEVVHHEFADDVEVVALMMQNAGPREVAAAIRAACIEREAAAYRMHNPEPPKVAAILSHGREVRIVDGMYEVQPPNDNYWCKFETLEKAIQFGECGDSFGAIGAEIIS